MTMKKAKIAVLVSGGGTNLQALLDAQAAGLLVLLFYQAHRPAGGVPAPGLGRGI